MHVYLDQNVFDGIEQKHKLLGDRLNAHNEIERLVLEGQITCPYSNAHINDLLRGHAKTPVYIPKHLDTIKRLTNNLCLVQYWGQSNATWHFRDVEEFFNSALDETDVMSKSFTELMDWDKTGLWKLQIGLLKSTPVPIQFKELYKASPVFKLMFPRTKVEPNMLSVCEDIYEFSNNSKKDYSLYKSLRTYVNQSRAKMRQHQKLFKELNKNSTQPPPYLNIDNAIDKYVSNTKTSDNPAYQKITDTYVRIDFKGFKSDDKFANLIDDSLHVFYGAHCDYFVTNDDKCHYKAAEVYHKLGISTKALKPEEFIGLLNE